MDTIEKSSQELINQFTNPENSKEVFNAQISNPLQELGLNIIDFFKKRLSYIHQTEDFRNQIRIALEQKIQENPEKISFTELSSLFIRLTEQNSLASEQIVSLLRPPQNSTINPFTSSTKKEDDLTKNSYDSETQRKVDIINRFIDSLVSKTESSNKP